jgi:general secretion pathway protein A
MDLLYMIPGTQIESIGTLLILETVKPRPMYLDHYHLEAKPFDISPGPRFLWLGEKHKEALATLTYGIKEDLGFLLLTGDVGVGKTALIHRLINNLDPSTIVAHITDPGLGTIDFFKLLAVEFNIPTEFYSKGPFLIELEKFLYAAYSDHKKVLLIVDEAQRLNNKLLDQIRVLSNIELSDRKLINIFFVGQPEFKNMLMANSNRAIRQRIAINYHINPLTESETGHYIEHRLKVAGAKRTVFKSNAIREIFRFTGGYPRAINVICDHALLTGYASGLKTIDSDVIKECERELNIRAGFDFSKTAFQTSTDTTQPETRQPPPRRSISMGAPMLIALFILLGALAVLLFAVADAPLDNVAGYPKRTGGCLRSANARSR